MTVTLCTANEVIHKCGIFANASVTASSAWVEEYINQAEGVIANEMRNNIVTNYASITAEGKQALNMACSNLAAMYIVNYDTSGYPDARSAEIVLDVLWNGYTDTIVKLRDDKNKSFLGLT